MASSMRATRTRATRRDGSRATGATLPTAGVAPQEQGLLVLGRYRLHRPLGAGGFGLVWLASDERLEREVAVKMLPRERIVSGRFEREARAAARLSHPGIVRLYEAAVDDDGAYLVSELVRGPTLAELMASGRLSDRDVVEIGIVLADALAHAHRQGVVHRDVKPSNVLVPEQPSSAAELAKLTDFGVARVIGGDTLTRTGDVLGTAAYMAPEQAEGRPAGAPADLYALALVLYEALTGVNPLASGEATRRARRLGAYLPALRRQRRDLPLELGRGIDLALRPRLRERGSLEELQAELRSALDHVEDQPGVVVSPWPSPWPRREPRDVSPWAASAPRDEPPAPAAAPPEASADAPGMPRLWPGRLLAGLLAGLLVGWISGRVLAPLPIAPAAMALISAVAVAVLPRIGWVAVSGGLVAGLAAQGRPGAALVLLIAVVLPIVLMPRRPTSWPLAGLAPALGAISLGGVWPVLASRGRTTPGRFGLGAAGWLWIVLGAALARHALYTTLPGALSNPQRWISSSSETADRVLPALLRPGLLAPALIWGLAAVVLPWIPRRPVPLTIVLVTVWSAVLASATGTLLRVLDAGARPESGVTVLGAVAAWIVALALSLAERELKGGASGKPPPGLA